jgi:hypothetical protein
VTAIETPGTQGSFREVHGFGTFVTIPCARQVDGPKTQDWLEFRPINIGLSRDPRERRVVRGGTVTFPGTW